MTERKQVSVNPLASAVHHKAGADFWQNRSHILQNELLVAGAKVDDLEAQVKDRDFIIAEMRQDSQSDLSEGE